MKNKRKKRNIKLKQTALSKNLSNRKALRLIPKAVVIISIILAAVGVFGTVFGIYSMVSASETKEALVDVKGEIVEVNNTDKNISVKYSYGDKTYTVILDHYENDMKKGDSVNLKINPGDLSETFKGWRAMVAAIGIAAVISSVCIILHTVSIIKKRQSNPLPLAYAWIVSAVLAFLSCALGLSALLSGRTTLGITVVFVCGGIFTVASWFLYVFDGKATSATKPRR